MDGTHCLCSPQQSKTQLHELQEELNDSKRHVLSARQKLAESRRDVAQLLKKEEQLRAAERAATYNEVSIMTDLFLRDTSILQC